ncbi:MAG: type II secretion system F family protein [Patescibacteria group bacterium]
MYIFLVKVRDAFGASKQVEISAATPQEAIKMLSDEGFYAELSDILKARRDSWLGKLQKIDFSSFFSRVPQKDVLRLVKIIGNSLDRGRTLKSTLDFVGENEDSKPLKKLIQGLREQMDKAFSSQIEIFSAFPQYFDEEFLGIIEAGETSSNLGKYLLDFVEEKKRQISLNTKFRAVLIKRLTTLVIVVMVAIVVVIFVIPQFKVLFGEALEIPWGMQLLMNISDAFKNFGPIILMVVGLGIATFYYLVVHNDNVRWWWHNFLLHMPVLGKTLRTYYTAQFTYLLSTLLTKNVDIIKSMNIIIRQSRNVCIKKTCKNIISSMQGGDDLFKAIIKEHEEERDYLVPAIVQAAKVGTATASLGATLMDVRDDLEELFTTRLERAIKVFSAFFYLFIVGFAVFLAYAIASAILVFYENAQQLI